LAQDNDEIRICASQCSFISFRRAFIELIARKDNIMTRGFSPRANNFEAFVSASVIANGHSERPHLLVVEALQGRAEEFHSIEGANNYRDAAQN